MSKYIFNQSINLSLNPKNIDSYRSIIYPFQAILKRGVLCAFLFHPWVYLHAETDAHLSLEDATQRVELYQATQGMWKTQQSIADANIKQSKLWINPELSIQQSGFDSNQEQELSIGISQPLDIFGERKAQQKVAKISLEQVGLQQKIYQAQLQLAVKYLWSQLALFELEREVVQAQLDVSQENLNAIQKRYQAGSVAQVDVSRAQMSHSENQRLYHQADLQLQLSTQQLSNIWGEVNKNIRVGLSASSLWPSSTEEQIQRYRSENLYEKSQRLQVLQSQAVVRHLQAQSRPNPTLNVGMNRTKSPEMSTENQVVVGVSIPLNIFNRQQYTLDIAQAKQAALSHQQKFYLKQNSLQVGTLLTELQGLKFQFQEVNQTQISLAMQVQRKTLMGFSAGKFSVTDVQQATLQLQNIQMLKLQILKDAWQRAIEVESLSLGIEPSTVMAKDAIAQINQTLWSETQALPVIGGGN